MSAPRTIAFRVLSLLAFFAAAPWARAAESYLEIVPDTALAFGAVNHLGPALDKVEAIAKKLNVGPVPNLLDTFKKETGFEKGVDDHGAAGFAVVPNKPEKESGNSLGRSDIPIAPYFFFAVTDEKAFLENFDTLKEEKGIREVKSKKHSYERYYLAFLHGYALFAPHDGGGEFYEAFASVLAAKKSIAAEMKGYETWLNENDGTLVGTSAGIKMASQGITDGLKSAGDGPGLPPQAAAFMRSFRDTFGKAAEAAPNEVSLAMEGVRGNEQGDIRLSFKAKLIRGGVLSTFAANVPAFDESPFASLPGGPFAFAFAGVGVPGLADSYVNFYGNLLKSMNSLGGDSDEMERMIKESAEVARQIRSMSGVMKLGKRSDPVYSNIYTILKVDNAERLLALHEKYVERVNKIAHDSKPGIIKSMSSKRITIAGKPAVESDVDFDFSNLPGMNGGPGQAMVEAMIGAGSKMVAYYVAVDEHTVLMGVGVSQDRMAAALETLEQPRRSLGADADVSITSAMLPKSQWLVYISFRGYSHLAIRLISAMAQARGGMGNSTAGIPVFPKSPPLGIGFKATADELQAEVAVPFRLIEATVEWEKQSEEMMMNRFRNGGPQPPAP